MIEKGKKGSSLISLRDQVSEERKERLSVNLPCSLGGKKKGEGKRDPNSCSGGHVGRGGKRGHPMPHPPASTGKRKKKKRKGGGKSSDPLFQHSQAGVISGGGGKRENLLNCSNVVCGGKGKGEKGRVSFLNKLCPP